MGGNGQARERQAEVVTLPRFWSKTILDANGCLVWGAARNEKGYGRFSYKGKNRRAHLVAYEIIKGKVPKGSILMHSCDNPSCVNPDHMTIGTIAQNNLDMRNKGRAGPMPDPVTRAKLTREQAEEIRSSQLDWGRLAIKYGVHRATIQKVIQRVTWK